MNERRLRIGVSGPAGSGKSTLVKALSEALSLPIIEEGMVPIYKAKKLFQNAITPPASPLDEQKQLLLGWMQSYFEWCEARRLSYLAHESFVADRWELDALGYWLQVFIPYRPEEDTVRLRKLFMERTSEFDLLVVLPVGSGDADRHNEVGLKRVQNIGTLMLTHNNQLGLLHHVPPSVARYAPIEIEPTETRVAAILDMVAKLKDRDAA